MTKERYLVFCHVVTNLEFATDLDMTIYVSFTVSRDIELISADAMSIVGGFRIIPENHAGIPSGLRSAYQNIEAEALYMSSYIGTIFMWNQISAGFIFT
jgi:hypothetical protein